MGHPSPESPRVHFEGKCRPEPADECLALIKPSALLVRFVTSRVEVRFEAFVPSPPLPRRWLFLPRILCASL